MDITFKRNLTVKCCRDGIASPDIPKPTFWRSDSSHIDKQKQFLKKNFDTTMAFSKLQIFQKFFIGEDESFLSVGMGLSD